MNTDIISAKVLSELSHLSINDTKLVADLWLKTSKENSSIQYSNDDVSSHIVTLLSNSFSLSLRSPSSISIVDHSSDKKRPHMTLLISCLNGDNIVNTITNWLQYLGYMTFDTISTQICVLKNKSETEIIVPQNSQDDAENIVLLAVNIEGTIAHKKRNSVKKQLLNCLALVFQVKKDRNAMLNSVKLLSEELRERKDNHHKECSLFIEWLNNEHFHITGVRTFQIKKVLGKFQCSILEKSRKGIFNSKKIAIFSGMFSGTEQDDKNIKSIVENIKVLRIDKGNIRSPVIRSTHIDVISVLLKYTENEYRLFHIAGLFSPSSYISSVFDIPVIRERCRNVINKIFKDKPQSFRREILDLINTYPRDEIYQSDDGEIFEAISSAYHSHNNYESDVYRRMDFLQRYSSIMVHFPRNLYREDLPSTIGHWVANKYNSIYRIHYSYMPDDTMWRIQIILSHHEDSYIFADESVIKQELKKVILSWHGRLIDELFSQQLELFDKDNYNSWLDLKNLEIFTPEYQNNNSIMSGVYDMGRLICLGDSVDLKLIKEDNPDLDKEQTLYHLKVYSRGSGVALHKLFPVLSNMGLSIIKEIPYSVSLDGKSQTHTINDFTFKHKSENKDFEKLKRNFEETCLCALNDIMPNDVFNRLALTVGLDTRAINLFRAYSWFLRQIGFSYTASTTVNVLIAHPSITDKIYDLFCTRFDPNKKLSLRDRVGASVRFKQEINDYLEHVPSLTDDLIFRNFVNVIIATVRTNFFQVSRVESPIALKFDSKKIDIMPEPRPVREIFIYSHRFEACHLRFGLVARGGIRFSDRSDDLRTEILGLAKAQQVKNSVIVPVGAKGGFVLKRHGKSREAYLQEGVKAYKTFISTMLDITDNRRGDKIIHPKGLIRYDGNDPYLVVAADKGTASFSDFANNIAIEKGFWLGDGFASGGSQGYDHKKMGITAKGAWESVKRHFHEIGINVQKEDFSVVGIGDMSGDVFGNGMLLSQHIKLVATFNHMHIFVDPNPDSHNSFKERKRLFNRKVSSWEDYDKNIMSKGGNIFKRASKSVTLSPEVMTLLETNNSKMTPNELIKLILKSSVDLIWFGGIGTYVKSSSESHTDVADSINNQIRVNAKDIRARVIGEGANLGLTQKARIEFAKGGGKCNTDAVDNSAGVDCSDHEVNIKILMNKLVLQQEISLKERNNILVKMTNNVSELVLNHNRRQNDALAVCLSQASKNLPMHIALINYFEEKLFLNRELEFLPDNQELSRRAASGVGLNAPELSILLAYDKNYTYKEIINSSLLDEDILEPILFNYFPKVIQEKFPQAIVNHPLRREIIATIITNNVIDHSGPGFINLARIETGATTDNVIRAYILTQKLINMDKIWYDLEQIRYFCLATAYARAHVETLNTLQRCINWILINENNISNLSLSYGNYRPIADTLRKTIPYRLPELAKSLVLDRAGKFHASGINEKLSNTLGSLKFLSCLFDISHIANKSSMSPNLIIKTYFLISELLDLDWMRTAANTIKPRDSWEQEAIKIAIDNLWYKQQEIAERCIMRGLYGNNVVDFLRDNYTSRLEQIIKQKNSIIANKTINVSSINVFSHSLSLLSNDIASQ